MPRPVIPRKYFLAVHDALKKVDRNGTISAFVAARGKFQSDMLMQLDNYSGGEEHTRDFATKLQHYMPHVMLKPRRHCITLEFPVHDIEMSLQLGMKGVTVDDVNNAPEYEERVPLRSSLGYDEERFMRSAPKMASLSAVLLEKWAVDNYPADLCPPDMYWLVHSYRVMEAYPQYDHHQIIFGSVMDKFGMMFERYPLDNPFCPGEDLNTLRTARNLCRAMNPHWDRMIEYKAQ